MAGGPAPAQPIAGGSSGAPGAGTGGVVGGGPTVVGQGGMRATAPSGGMMNTGGAPGSAGVGASGTGGIHGTGGMPSMMMTGGSGGGPGGSGGMSATHTSLALTFDVTTVDQGGRYSPRNVGAIWIETGAGAFVKTLEVWAGTRGRYLTRFNSEAGGSRVDAVTSATLRSYGAHHDMWNLTDANGAAVPNGDYKVVFEVTDQDWTGQSGEAPFTYNGMAMKVMPADQPFYTGMTIAVQ
jgi:hypothetical protein